MARELVEKMYHAFVQGTLEILYDALDENVEWAVHGTSDIPFAGTFHGVSEVKRFISILAETTDVTRFDVERFITQDDTVVVTGSESVRIKDTGKTANLHWADIWTVKNGKIVKFQEYGANAEMAEAYRR